MTRAGQVRHVVAWLPAVRWSTSTMLWVVFVVAWWWPHLNLPLRTILPIGLTAAFCRTLVAATARHDDGPREWLCGLALTIDVVLLTGLLEITGGPFNPFIVMFVPYVWLATVGVSARWGLLVGVVAAGGFGWLVHDHFPAEVAAHHRWNDFPTHLFTMWVSGATIAELVAHYVAGARATLAERQQQLEAARERAYQSEHLAALTTLAAGAAHELSTPLSTIAVAARELQRNADTMPAGQTTLERVRDDARLIREEVDRCQAILDGMSGRALDGGPSATASMAPQAIADLVCTRLSDQQRARLLVEIGDGVLTPAARGTAVVQAVASLLKNAFDASDTDTSVALRFAQQGHLVRIEVKDHGAGMSTETIRRVGEPFYTTKEAGRGLGLGVFLTRALAERAGGALSFRTGDGTTAVLDLPAASTTTGAPA